MTDHKPQRTEEEEEVRIKKIRILGAIAGTVVAAIFYLAIPYWLQNYFIPNYKDYITADITIVWENIVPLLDRWFWAGIPMVVLGAITWMCPKGSRQRFITSTIYLAASIVWFVYVINFGDMSDLINVTYDGKTIEIGIVLTFMLYLLILFRALKILIIYGVYKDNRKDYLDGE